MADPTDVAPEKRPFPFMDLPAEMRDMVYDFAYGDERTVKIRSRRTFEQHEDAQAIYTKHYARRAFPESYLSDMLVSKQFFEDAARVWIASKTFYIGGAECMLDFGRMSPVEACLFSSITSLHLGSLCFEILGVDRLVRLNKLELELDNVVFSFGRKRPWRDSFTDTEIAGNYYVKRWLKTRGITALSMHWMPGCYAYLADQEDADMFDRFKAQFEKLFRDVVLQPREQQSASGLPSLAEALEKNWKSPNRRSTVRAQQDVQTLADDQVPENEDALLRTFLLQPTAVLKWIQDAKKMKAQHAAPGTAVSQAHPARYS